MKKFIRIFIQAAKQKPEKLLQYFMLVFLFGLAIFLPLYGMRHQVRESSSDFVSEENQTEYTESRL